MPCIDCGNGVEICGPDASQGDCDAFEGIDDAAAAAGKDKCPDGWCLERVCTDEDGKKYSIWRPTGGRCREHAYTPYRGWHEQCSGC